MGSGTGPCARPRTRSVGFRAELGLRTAVLSNAFPCGIRAAFVEDLVA